MTPESCWLSGASGGQTCDGGVIWLSQNISDTDSGYPVLSWTWVWDWVLTSVICQVFLCKTRHWIIVCNVVKNLNKSNQSSQYWGYINTTRVLNLKRRLRRNVLDSSYYVFNSCLCLCLWLWLCFLVVSGLETYNIIHTVYVYYLPSVFVFTVGVALVAFPLRLGGICVKLCVELSRQKLLVPSVRDRNHK